MKIALCFAGQPRSFAAAYPYYKKHILDTGIKVDVFLHAWNTDSNQEIVDLYQPVDYLFEDALFSKELDLKYRNTYDVNKWPPRFTASSFYSILQVNLLKIKHEIKTTEYDWVIKTRYDYALNGFLPFEKLEKGKLYIPNCRMVPTRDFGNDQFAFGDSYVMNQYMSTFMFMEHYYKQGSLFNAEDLMSANLKKHGLVGENLVYVNMNNPFPPGPYNGTWHSLIREDMELWRKM